MTTEVIHHKPTGALVVAEDQKSWTPEQEAALKQIGLAGASPADASVFLHYCQRTGLDPFARQIYMIGRWSPDGTKWTIQASIDGLRIVALRTGQYDGQLSPEWCGEDGAWRDVWLSVEPPAAARVGVRRRGFSTPVYGVAIYREYVQTKKDGAPTKMWEDKPAGQLAKCAEALALRKAFPHDLAGVYTDDEMGRADDAPEPVTAPNRPGPGGIIAAAESVRNMAATDALVETGADGGPIVDLIPEEDKPAPEAGTAPDETAPAPPPGEPLAGDQAEPVAQDADDASEAQRPAESVTDPDGPITAGQRNRVLGLFTQAGITTKAAKVAYVVGVADRDDPDNPITGSNDLTAGEADRVIAALEARIAGAK